MPPAKEYPEQGGHQAPASGETNDGDCGIQSASQKDKAVQCTNCSSISGSLSGSDYDRCNIIGQDKLEETQNGNSLYGLREENASPSHPSCKQNEDPLASRIPRGPVARQVSGIAATPQKGGRFTPEHRSSIPVAVHRHSVEQLGVGANAKQNDPSFNGIRVADKPRGPRPRPSAEQNDFAILESTQETEEMAHNAPPSSSSSISSWDFDDDDEPEKPLTVYTGEYRTRPLNIPGHTISSPTLKIDSSADHIIMGGASRSPSFAVTQRSDPAKVKYLDTIVPSASRETGSQMHANSASKETPKVKPGNDISQENTPVTRNFCRPQISLESVPKRDFSKREMAVPRKPITRPSFMNIFTPPEESFQSETEPLMPKFLERHAGRPKNDTSPSTIMSVEPVSPARCAEEPNDAPPDSAVLDTPTPVTAQRITDVKPHPPRTSSLRALSDFPVDTESQHSPATETDLHSDVNSRLNRNVTFNDLVPESLGQEHTSQGSDKARLPESKSNNILGSFRNMFKSRAGLTDARSRIKKEDIYISGPVRVDPTLTSEEFTKKIRQINIDSEKTPKTRPKYTRLSGGVGWSKGSRNPKAADDSPASPSVPRLLAPSTQVPDDQTPSFARPTKSTRTKAASGSKGQAATSTEIRARRAHVRTSSTGSPHRLNRGSRRATRGFTMLQAPKAANQARKMATHLPSPASETGVSTANGANSTDSIPKSLDAVRSCLETLCKKVGEAATPLERDRHLRLALNLQQQLGDYQSIEKAVLEAEALVKEKHSERRIAESCLDTTLTEVQAQLNEE